MGTGTTRVTIGRRAAEAVTFDTIGAPDGVVRQRQTGALEEFVGDPIWSGPATVEAVNGSAIAVAEIDLATRRVVAASDAAAAMVGLDRAQIIGRPVSDFVDGEPTGGIPLLATGQLEGFEAQRRLRHANGTIVKAYVWAHVLGSTRPARYGAAFLMDGESEQPHSLWLASPASDQRVIGTVDDEWRIDRISQEVRVVLGYSAA